MQADLGAPITMMSKFVGGARSKKEASGIDEPVSMAQLRTAQPISVTPEEHLKFVHDQDA